MTVAPRAFPRSRVVTVVMAAGAGKRLGGPKALLEWPSAGRAPIPLAIAHAEERLAAESGRVLIVTRQAIVPSLLAYVRPGIDLLASDAEDELGPAGSLGYAASRLGDVDVVIATPVDTQPAKRETVAELVLALAARPELRAARPIFHGRGGHPVALRAAVLARYAAPRPPPLRDVLHEMGDACASVDVTDPTVVLDLDTPADVMGTLGVLPRFFK